MELFTLKQVTFANVTISSNLAFYALRIFSKINGNSYSSKFGMAFILSQSSHSKILQQMFIYIGLIKTKY